MSVFPNFLSYGVAFSNEKPRSGTKGCLIVYRAKQCPVAFCHASVKNMSRHLVQVHHLKAEEQTKLLQYQSQTAQVQPNRVDHKNRPSLKECVLCSRKLRRIDCHLASLHGLKRSSQKFRTLLDSVSIYRCLCYHYCFSYIPLYYWN